MTITWEQILAFLCEDQSMAITSLLFLAFFAAVALINYALPRVLRPYFLLIASYGFFAMTRSTARWSGSLPPLRSLPGCAGLSSARSKTRPCGCWPYWSR